MKRNSAALSEKEIAEAHGWWVSLADDYKGSVSIWVLLAMYARDWAKQHTVTFSRDEVVAEVGRPRRVPKGEHTRVLDKEQQKA